MDKPTGRSVMVRTDTGSITMKLEDLPAYIKRQNEHFQKNEEEKEAEMLENASLFKLLWLLGKACFVRFL